MKWTTRLINQKVSIYPLIYFRIIWGLVTFISTIRFISLGWIEKQYLQPKFHFTYFGFEWVHPLPSSWLYAVFFLLSLSSLCIIIGWQYKLAATVFFLLFTYIELIDISYYLNHYYFVSLVSFWMILLPAHRYFSVTSFRYPNSSALEVPAWCINIIKFHILIVYFFAGIAKINTDWLFHALPLKIWLPAHDDMWAIGWLLKYAITAYIFSWFGMIFDIVVPFALIWKQSRVWAYVAVVIFHCISGYLFQIGVFPMVMIASTTIFFNSKFHVAIIRYLAKLLNLKLDFNHTKPFNSISNTFTRIILPAYIVFQLLFPLRYLLYPGNLFWTEQGYRFSWRVMLMEKAGTATFYVKDRSTGREGVVDNSEFLNLHQEKQMSFQPDMILQYAHLLHDYYVKKGMADPIVRAEVYVTLNGRPSQLFINPTIDLAKIKDGWNNKEWILPYHE